MTFNNSRNLAQSIMTSLQSRTKNTEQENVVVGWSFDELRKLLKERTCVMLLGKRWKEPWWLLLGENVWVTIWVAPILNNLSMINPELKGVILTARQVCHSYTRNPIFCENQLKDQKTINCFVVLQPTHSPQDKLNSSKSAKKSFSQKKTFGLLAWTGKSAFKAKSNYWTLSSELKKSRPMLDKKSFNLSTY